MKKFNVVVPKKIQYKTGEEKTLWNNVGVITQFDNGGLVLELNMFPNTDFKVFPQENRQNNSNNYQSKQSNPSKDELDSIDFDDPDLVGGLENPDDIPY